MTDFGNSGANQPGQPSASSTSWRFSATISQLHENLSRRFHISELAQETGISVRHFHQLCRQELGTNFVKYYRDLRMERASELLIGSEQSIKTIALDLGYGRIEVFCREFRKVFLCTPTEYRLCWRRKAPRPEVVAEKVKLFAEFVNSKSLTVGKLFS